ncbi:histidine phosphatase family protein [Microbacterium sp. KR10-403]|uniref:histidine phosphatase family protein n=1 Tax=Microbacterium sp. KR10-403 TaxID=3158581 RepID=UPI0032E43097
MPELTRRTMLTGGLSSGALAVGALLVGSDPALAAIGSSAGRKSGPHTTTAMVYLLRHGETWLNVVGAAQGWSDAPLTKTWAPTANLIGKNLAQSEGRFTAAFSGDMGRHYETATRVLAGARSSLRVTRDERLREVAFGGFDGGDGAVMWTAAANKLGYASQSAALKAGATILDLVDAAAALNPDPEETVAETSAEVADRMEEGLNDIVQKSARSANAKILVVSSGLSIAALFTKWGIDDQIPAGGLKNGSVSKLQWDRGSWSALSVGDVSFQS